jgi:adenylate cyclase
MVWPTVFSRWPARLRFLLTLLPVVVGLLHASRLWPISFLTMQDAQIYDARLRASMPRTLDPRIVIVDVDETSLFQVGRWPWDRDQLAAMTRELTDRQKALVVGYDFVFAEPDQRARLADVSSLKQAFAQHAAGNKGLNDSLSQWLAVNDHDAQFEAALKNSPVVLGYYFTSDRNAQKTGQLPPPLVPSGSTNMQMAATEWNGYGSNLARFSEAAAGSGFFNAVIAANGVVRALPALARYNGELYESLALATWRVAYGKDSVTFSPRKDLGSAGAPVLESLRLRLPSGTSSKEGERYTSWPLDNRGAVLVPYRGEGGPNGGSFEYVSASDVLFHRLPAGHLAGKIVLIGSTAPGLQDLRLTPVGPTFPGVEVHANMLSGTLDGRQLYQPDYAMGLDLLLIALAGLVLAILLPRLNAGAALLLGLGFALAVTLGNAAMFWYFGMVLPLAALVATILLALTANMSYGYFIEGYAKRSLAQIFGTYVPPELVQEMLKRPNNYSMKASNQELTVMYCDLRGFTQLAEAMAPPEVQKLLNIVFDHLTAVIRQHGGTIDKYMGDCVMAFWGAPVSQANHAEKAVLAAIALCKELPKVNGNLQLQKLPQVGFTIGLATGMMSVGDMGSKVRRSYTVIGDAVNLGARLQRLCERYQVAIIASHRTYECAPGLAWRYLDTVNVRGKTAAVAVYTPEMT